MMEIGGYLELDDLIHREYYPDAIALNTARNAVVYLARSKNIEKIYIPYYLCDSVAGVCDKQNIKYEFYNINEKFLPLFDKKLGKNEYLYIVNFFGQLDEQYIKDLKVKHENLILDNVQAFFSHPIAGVDTVYSCRKFFGVPDGAYLVSDAPHLDLPVDVSRDRMRHILGRYEGQSASDYYSDFRDNDEMFDNLPLMYMSKLTHNILGAINYEYIIAKRNHNWKVLHGLLGKKNKLILSTPYAPYMYPFYCENGMEIKQKLASKKIFVPTLWPNVLDSDCGEIEKHYAKNILPLPIDQRYGTEDVQRIVDVVSIYLG